VQVDCAYSVLATQESQLDPVRDIKRALEAAKEQDIEADCPECFANQLQWFCASLFPKCGSVRASFETQMLPIIAEVMLPPPLGSSLAPGSSWVDWKGYLNRYCHHIDAYNSASI